MAIIGIDCRLWGTKHTGIGRYTQKLVENLQKIGDNNEYIIFCRSEDYDDIGTSVGWKKVRADIPHYTLGEQTHLVQIFLKENLDLLHVPHFNVPIFYPKKFVITIHDILWHTKKGFDVTTLPPITYLAKYAGYRLVVKNAANRAKAIFVPSRAVAGEVANKFPGVKKKIHVTYEGVDSLPKSKAETKEKYLLYVGNLYPHKNVHTLVKALSRYHVLEHGNKLVVVSGRSAFLDKFKKFLQKESLDGFVELKTNASDKELSALYKNALALVFPTLSEGFGLPGLEAMMAGTPVICSDIPVLHEVYGKAALYFDPKNSQDIADKIQKVLNDHMTRMNLVKASKNQLKKYSWEKMAQETFDIYREVLKR